MKALALLTLLVVAGPVLADGEIITKTTKASEWVLKRSSDSSILSRHATEEACVAALNLAGDFRCDKSISIKAVGACSPTKPEFKIVLNKDGVLELPELKVEALADGSWGPTLEQGYLPDVQPFPKCWVLGWVPYTGKWEAPEGPGVDEPTGWPKTP